MNKYSYSSISKLLEKLFKAGFREEKSIINIQLEDLRRINDISSNDINILIDLKKAIKDKKVIAFLSGKEERKEGKENESRV